jgi:NitT/TauT family transport system permease protein
VILLIPSYWGVNAAVIFLIFTSMAWNMAFGVYEAIKTMPAAFNELSRLYNLTMFQRLTKIYIPASLPRLIEQSVLSWSIGLFYLVTSEIFSTGNANYSVKYGIGIALTNLALSTAPGHLLYYVSGILVFIAFVVATRFLFFMPLERYATRYMRQASATPQKSNFKGLTGRITRPMQGIRVFRRISALRKEMAVSIRRTVHPEAAAIRHGTQTVGKQGRVYPGRLKYLYTAVAVAVVLALLYMAHVITPAIVSAEYQTLVAMFATFARVWLTFLLILAVSVPVCVYLVFIARNSNKYRLLFQVLASIPATILLPLIVSWTAGFPARGEIVAFIVFFLSGLWYIIFSVMASTRTLPSSILEVKRIFNVNGKKAWKYIYLQAILPGLITGSVTAIAAEWNASIVAEYFTASSGAVLTQVGTGLGKFLDLALSSGNLTIMAVGLINFVAIILIINTFVWKRLYGRISKIYGE